MTTSGPLTEQDFERVADRDLRRLDAALSDLDGLEADLESGILTIEFADGDRYVVNSHRAARQIWMAAERAAWHFDYRADEGRWIATKTGDELWAALEKVIGDKLGKTVLFPR